MSSRASQSVQGTNNCAGHQIFNKFSGTKKERKHQEKEALLREKEALLQQVEELKAELQRAEEHDVSQEKNLTELSNNLKSETKENKELWDQIEYLNVELHKEKTWIKEQRHLFRKERAKFFNEQKLRIKLGKELEETKKQLVHERRQVEELKAELQRAEEHHVSQEKSLTELSNNLMSETKENKELGNQIEYLSVELHKEKTSAKEQRDLYRNTRAKYLEQQTLRIKLGRELQESQKQLADEGRQVKLLVKKQNGMRKKVENIRVSQRGNQRYEAERTKSDTVQQQLEKERRRHSVVVSEYQEEIQWLKAEQDGLKFRMEQHCYLLRKEKATSSNELTQRTKLGQQLEESKKQSNTFQHLLETERRSHSETLSEHQEEIQRLKAEQDAFKRSKAADSTPANKTP
ncbi:trichohyalin-like [Brachyistius frenatus]|uniref:trichohyalin-like n=1 Tax=Brachyistius frenatus TaxID=100188 RepID=UPI0037E7954A